MISEQTRAAACPKCGNRLATSATACPRCGLTLALWTPALAAAVVRLDQRGEALWTKVRAQWDAESAHDEFLKHCSTKGLLAAAGRCYRERLDEAPDDAMAARMQERIVTMATVSFAVRPTTPPTPVTRTGWFWVMVVVCGIGGIVGAFLLRH